MGRLNDRRQMIAAFIAGLALSACAGLTYKTYGLKLQDECYDAGTLLGPKAKDDLPFARCKPDAANKGKCRIMFNPEYERMRTDLADCRNQLQACQGG